jgi:GNAT superfamily N-acetyltransferase
MTVSISPLTRERLADLEKLFTCADASNHCRCMWFIKPVSQFHQDGAQGNWSDLKKLSNTSELPLGLIAYHSAVAIGWCAVGPRSRYARAIKTPTYKGRDPNEDGDVWLIPCLFTRPDWRGTGLSRMLVGEALNVAKAHNATAVEAFPYAGNTRRGKDTQVGFEPLFESHGFKTIRRPSESRIIMRVAF